MSEDNFVESVLTLYKEKKWKDIIDNFHGESYKNKLCWIFPSENNINFINSILRDNNLNDIISVGCGSGLLEWILMESLGISIIGVEIYGCWWNCKYASPTFIPLHIANLALEEDESTKKILKNKCAAIMFCYFNNWIAFENYIKHFAGDTLIIIGPGEGRCTHTDPAPFDMKLSNKWTLTISQEVRDTKDYIAVYKKKIT